MSGLVDCVALISLDLGELRWGMPKSGWGSSAVECRTLRLAQGKLTALS